MKWHFAVFLLPPSILRNEFWRGFSALSGRPDCLVYDYNLVYVAIQPTKRKNPKVSSANCRQNSKTFYGQGTRHTRKEGGGGITWPYIFSMAGQKKLRQSRWPWLLRCYFWYKPSYSWEILPSRVRWHLPGLGLHHQDFAMGDTFVECRTLNIFQLQQQFSSTICIQRWLPKSAVISHWIE